MSAIEVSSESPYEDPVAIIWFRRDLRLQDHGPLSHAIEQGLPVLPIFNLEPERLSRKDASMRHLRFQYESLLELEDELVPYDTSIHIFHRKVIHLLQDLQTIFPQMLLFSHQETGIKSTRDELAGIRKFCKENGIVWEEFPNHGVIPGLQEPKEWEQCWFSLMNEPIYQVDLGQLQPIHLSEEWLEEHQGEPLPAGLMRRQKTFQRGGIKRAHTLWDAFLQQTTEEQENTTSPVETTRLSPYIAWGNVSIRRLYQSFNRQFELPAFPKKMHPFILKLWKHCYAIQRLESEPRMEFENLNRAFSSIRNDHDEDKIQAWKKGETGYPLVDAAMQCVVETGSLSFRLRALLVSFLTHHLWQDWREGVNHLAQQFLDYEPGIHYHLFQIHASTTGLEKVQVFDPVKESTSFDPEGRFILKWLPELSSLPLSLLHTPWKMTGMEQNFFQCRLGIDYPYPIVNATEAGKFAKEILQNLKASPETKAESKRIQARMVPLKRIHKQTTPLKKRSSPHREEKVEKQTEPSSQLTLLGNPQDN